MLLRKIETYFRLGLLSFSKSEKVVLLIFVDCWLIAISVWFSFYLRIGQFLPLHKETNGHYPLNAILACVLTAVPILWRSGFYKMVVRFSDRASVMQMLKAFMPYGFISITILTLFGIEGVPRTIGVIQPAILFGLLVGSRCLFRFWLSGSLIGLKNLSSKKKVLIYGAGTAGQRLVNQMSNMDGINAIGFIDDDEGLHARYVS